MITHQASPRAVPTAGPAVGRADVLRVARGQNLDGASWLTLAQLKSIVSLTYSISAEKYAAACGAHSRYPGEKQILYEAATNLWMNGVDMTKAISIVHKAMKDSGEI